MAHAQVGDLALLEETMTDDIARALTFDVGALARTR
jgi:hypothetical protein